VSSDFERLLRQARETLPGPDEAATLRARRRALAAVRGRRRLGRGAGRFTVTLAAAFLVALGLGVGIGALIAPTGGASRGPLGVGFLPERGWNVLQSATAATPEWPAQSIAANVPLRPEDDADGLPYSTLLSLPPNGVVFVATFTVRGVEPYHDVSFPARTLPLRLRDMTPLPHFGAQVRPARPLGQYQLLAGVNGHNVNLNAYFGTQRPSPALITTAQRQLDRLVVRPVPETNLVEERALPLRQAQPPRAASGVRAASRIIDRTFRCTPVALTGGGGLRELTLTVEPRGSNVIIGARSPQDSPGAIGVSTGGHSPTSDLVAVRAGSWQRFARRNLPAGVYARAGRCASARESLPISPAGLPGPPIQWRTNDSCGVRGRILVRVRAVLRSPGSWRRADATYFGARRNVAEAALAIRSERTRKPVAFLELGASGKTRAWISPGACA
jgi:hypothetical protein